MAAIATDQDDAGDPRAPRWLRAEIALLHWAGVREKRFPMR